MSRVYRAMLRAYPREFREKFGDELMLLFADQQRDAVNPLLFWAGILGDWLVSVAQQQWKEGTMIVRILGSILILGALANIIYDGLHPAATMGALAILLTCVVSSVGSVLLFGRRRAA